MSSQWSRARESTRDWIGVGTPTSHGSLPTHSGETCSVATGLADVSVSKGRWLRLGHRHAYQRGSRDEEMARSKQWCFGLAGGVLLQVAATATTPGLAADDRASAAAELRCTGTELVSLLDVSPRPLFELRYASPYNFLSRTLYSQLMPRLRSQLPWHFSRCNRISPPKGWA